MAWRERDFRRDVTYYGVGVRFAVSSKRAYQIRRALSPSAWWAWACGTSLEAECAMAQSAAAETRWTRLARELEEHAAIWAAK